MIIKKIDVSFLKEIFLIFLTSYLLILAIDNKNFFFLFISIFLIMERISLWLCANETKHKWFIFSFIFPITLYVFSSQIL